MKTCVILNPGARKVEPESIDTVRSALSRLEGATVLITEQDEGAAALAREALANGYELIIAAGGDGTINEVVNGLSEDFSRATLGVIPLGTGNDFARSIDVPVDLEAAVEIVAAGRTRQMDVVRVLGGGVKYFINMAAGGFSGQVGENLTDEMKTSWGPLAYLRSGFETIPELTDYRTSIQFDEDDAEEIGVYNIVVANARYVGGGIPVAPEALLDDGLLDVVIVPAASLTQMALLLPQILLGQHMGSKLLVFRRARRVSIFSEPGMWFNLDGEMIGKEPITFELLPGALRVITGPEPVALCPPADEP